MSSGSQTPPFRSSRPYQVTVVSELPHCRYSKWPAYVVVRPGLSATFVFVGVYFVPPLHFRDSLLFVVLCRWKVKRINASIKSKF